MARKKIDQKDDRKTRIFLSYSRKDLGFAEFLKAELDKAGYQPSLDKTDIAPGEAWQDRLSKLIQNADAVVFCLSPHSAASKICGWEVDEAAKLGKRIIPAVADAVEPSALPDALTKLNLIFFADVSFEDAFAKLRSALDNNLDWIRLHTRLGELALEWQARNNASSQLLFGRSLSDAEIWSSKRPTDAELPTPLQLHYIAASRSAASSRQRLGLIGAFLVAAVSLGLFVWGEINRQEAVAQRAKAAQAIVTGVDAAKDLNAKIRAFADTSGVSPEITNSLLLGILKLQTDLIAGDSEDVRLQVDQSKIFIQVSDTYVRQGQPTEGEKYSRQSIDVLEALLNSGTNKAYLQEPLSAAYTSLGSTLMEQGKSDDAKPFFEKALIAAEEDSKFVIATNFRFKQYSKAVSFGNLGMIKGKLMKPEDNLEEFSNELEYAERSLKDLDSKNDSYYDFRLELAQANLHIGEYYQDNEKFSDANDSLKRAIDILSEIGTAAPNNVDVQTRLARANQIYGLNVKDSGDVPGAKSYFEAYYNITKNMAAPNDKNTDIQNNYAVANMFLGNYFNFDLGDKKLAGPYYTEAIRVGEQLVSQSDDVPKFKTTLASYLLAESNILVDPKSELLRAKTLLKQVADIGPLSPTEQNLSDLVDQSLSALTSQ